MSTHFPLNIVFTLGNELTTCISTLHNSTPQIFYEENANKIQNTGDKDSESHSDSVLQILLKI